MIVPRTRLMHVNINSNREAMYRFSPILMFLEYGKLLIQHAPQQRNLPCGFVQYYTYFVLMVKQHTGDPQCLAQRDWPKQIKAWLLISSCVWWSILDTSLNSTESALCSHVCHVPLDWVLSRVPVSCRKHVKPRGTPQLYLWSSFHALKSLPKTS